MNCNPWLDSAVEGINGLGEIRRAGSLNSQPESSTCNALQTVRIKRRGFGMVLVFIGLNVEPAD